MGTYLQGHGQTPLLSSTALGPGPWVPVHPRIRNMAFQAVAQGGGNVSAVVQIQASLDGINPCATQLGQIAISSAASPGADGFAIDSHWNYVRANLLSAAGLNAGSSNLNVIATAHDVTA